MDKRKLFTWTSLVALPLALASFFVMSHPFRDELASRTFGLSYLSPTQINNIAIASNSLNGYVLEPGQVFSFNRVVGPRTDSRGYRSARSYLGNESPATFGGGICLLSSGLYQDALIAGLKIEERLPHMRTIASVEPGLDATVWYGNADLKFRNITAHPMQIKAEVKDHNLYIKFLSENASDMPARAELKTFIARRSQSELMVEVFRNVAGKRSFVSRDHYQLSSASRS